MVDALGAYASSYELTNALRLDIEDMVSMLTPHDAPYLGTYNGLENAPVPAALPTGDVFEVQYDWLDDELLLPRSEVGATPFVGGAGNLILATGGAAGFQPDDVVEVANDDGSYGQYLVTAVNYGTDTLTLASWAGTEAAAATGNEVIGIGTIPVEGADPQAARATDRDRRHNVTQIFGPYPVELTETEQVVLKYGVTNEWDHQTAKRVKEAVVAMEQAILYGVRKNDTSAKRRSMGGINYFIDATNGSTVDTTTTDLAATDGTGGEDKLLELQQGCYNNGGDPRLVTVGPIQRPKISGWRKSDIRFQLSEQRRGQIVTQFESEFGLVDVLLHRWMRSNHLFLTDREQQEVCTLTGRQMRWVMTAKTGDRDSAYVITEKGFKFRRAKHAAKMTNLAA